MSLHYTHPNGPIIEEIGWLDTEEVFMTLADAPNALWLDSSDTAHNAGRYSFIVHAPYETVHVSAQEAALGFTKLKDALRRHAMIWHGLPPEIDAILPPFRGGAAGLFSYNLAYGLHAAADFEPDENTLMQDAAAMAQGLYASVLAFDHQAHRAFIIATGLPAENGASRMAAAQADIAQWKARFKDLRQLPSPHPCAPKANAIAPNALSSNFDAASYRQAVRDTVDAILAGDIFQANITQCFSATLNEDDTAFTYYRRLRRQSPAPFSAFYRFDGVALACASPERFLKSHKGCVESRPIKGTAPRETDPVQDAAIAAALLTSEKNRAENVMIVDLLRNDLAKSCADGSISVPDLCRLESFSNVHHLVSTVRGQLAEGKTALDALQESFPGGSITGAPKLRAMRHISETEKHGRGASYGAIGWLGFDGNMDTNIIIRTALLRGREIQFHVGGGTVADSDPHSEYEETLNKARGLLAALGISRDEVSLSQKAQDPYEVA